jgi:glycine/D-amino acid oxidase-like deaminating enzyme
LGGPIWQECDVLISGGGFFGLYLAEYLAARVGRVILCERESQLMQRASYSNQARVHNGYHYPRSILTALRSRINFTRFVKEFEPAIDSSFHKVYAVGRRLSKVTADQFYEIIRRIGAPIRPAPPSIASLFDSAYIESAFLTQEFAFNSLILRQIMAERVNRAGVEVHLQACVRSIRPASGPSVEVEVVRQGKPEILRADHVFCCAYSQVNAPGGSSGLPCIPLKHELAELALVEVPDHFKALGITVMDGPFFSLMPFPPRRLHTLSHVRYTPHACWYDGPDSYTSPYKVFEQAQKETAFPYMIRDAARYVPGLIGSRYQDSLWEVKTVLPRSETDDSRPILFKPHHGIPNYHLVMGAKIDNVYDVLDVISETFAWTRK